MTHTDKRLKEIGRGKKNIFQRPKRTRVNKPQGPRGRMKFPRRKWAWSNYGNLIGIERTRKLAQTACEKHSEEPWEKCRAYMEVWECEVRPLPSHGKGAAR